MVSLLRPATTTAIAAAAKNGKVSKKLACARFSLPASGLSGTSGASRADAFHFMPRSRVTTADAAKMYTKPSSIAQASIVSSVAIAVLRQGADARRL